MPGGRERDEQEGRRGQYPFYGGRVEGEVQGEEEFGQVNRREPMQPGQRGEEKIERGFFRGGREHRHDHIEHLRRMMGQRPGERMVEQGYDNRRRGVQGSAFGIRDAREESRGESVYGAEGRRQREGPADPEEEMTDQWKNDEYAERAEKNWGSGRRERGARI
jgi:hypothetical protein